MLPASAYKILHLFGILFVFASLGGLSLHALNGGTRATNASRRLVAWSYGGGLLLILVTGFGQLARLGLMEGGVPGWAWGKLVVWLALGGLLSVPYRHPERARLLWFGAPVLGAAAAYLALYKPF
ncbi:MAG: hypothetical protein ACE5HF_03810 [Gemmatimonadota bacterium]